MEMAPVCDRPLIPQLNLQPTIAPMLFGHSRQSQASHLLAVAVVPDHSERHSTRISAMAYLLVAISVGLSTRWNHILPPARSFQILSSKIKGHLRTLKPVRRSYSERFYFVPGGFSFFSMRRGPHDIRPKTKEPHNSHTKESTMISRFGGPPHRLYVIVATWSLYFIGHIQADLVLSKQILQFAIHGAELSGIVKASQQQQQQPPPLNHTYIQQLGLDILEYVPGKAIVAKIDNYCHVTYHGSSMTWIHWDAQDFGREKICFQQDHHQNETSCCSTRIGFAKAYNYTSHIKVDNAIRKCAKQCTNPDECVIFSGHSEGGAVAAIAALNMADLNPYIVTFGQPSTIDTPCSMLSAERFFRFVNTKVALDGGIVYDPVPFIQGLGADNFGYMIFLGKDPQRVASIGLATRTADFRLNMPFGSRAPTMVESHTIAGYLSRLQTLMNSQAAFPIQSNGFENGAICNEAMECRSGRCRLQEDQNINWTTCVAAECVVDQQCDSSEFCHSGECLSKLQSCMTCQNDADCSSGKCLWYRCAGSSALLDNNCDCKGDVDCSSHRCRFGICEAKLPLGATCISNDDCSSGVCGNIVHLKSNTILTSLRCHASGNLGLVSVDTGEKMNANPPCPIRTKMNWGSMFVVVFCCMIITFYIMKRCLYCRRKDYSIIPNAEFYV